MTPEPRRCPWCGVDPLYIRYHDEEGVNDHLTSCFRHRELTPEEPK